MNQFMRAALEAHNQELSNLGVEPDDKPLPELDGEGGLAHPDETANDEVQQRLVAEQENSTALAQELAESETEKEDIATQQYSDTFETAVAAMESLMDLGSAVGYAIESGYHHESANMGFAIALESIVGTVQMSALEDAESNSRALMLRDRSTNWTEAEAVDDAAEEKAKTGGILETIKEKVKAVWRFIVSIARRATDYVMTLLANSKIQQEMIRDGEITARMRDAYKSNFRTDYRLQDKEILSTLNANEGEDPNETFARTASLVGNMPAVIKEIGAFVEDGLDAANYLGDRDINRNDIMGKVASAAKVMTRAFAENNSNPPEYIKSLVRNSNAEVSFSGRLAGGYYVWGEVEERRDQMPKLGMFCARDRAEKPAQSVPLLDPRYIERFNNAMHGLSQMGQKELMEMSRKLKQLSPTRSFSFRKTENIEDDTRFMSACVGEIGKLSIQLANLVTLHILNRMNLVFHRYFMASYKVMEKENQELAELRKSSQEYKEGWVGQQRRKFDEQQFETMERMPGYRAKRAQERDNADRAAEEAENQAAKAKAQADATKA